MPAESTEYTITDRDITSWESKIRAGLDELIDRAPQNEAGQKSVTSGIKHLRDALVMFDHLRESESKVEEDRMSADEIEERLREYETYLETNDRDMTIAVRRSVTKGIEKLKAELEDAKLRESEDTPDPFSADAESEAETEEKVEA